MLVGIDHLDDFYTCVRQCYGASITISKSGFEHARFMMGDRIVIVRSPGTSEGMMAEIWCGDKEKLLDIEKTWSAYLQAIFGDQNEKPSIDESNHEKDI